MSKGIKTYMNVLELQGLALPKFVRLLRRILRQEKATPKLFRDSPSESMLRGWQREEQKGRE